jgi:hypothetical protein
MYIDPPNAQEIDQGLILDGVYFYAIDEVRPAFVLTPACDIAQQKADFLQVSAVWEAREVLQEFVQDPWRKHLSKADGTLLNGPLSKNKEDWLVDRIKELIAQRFQRWHWLAPIPGTASPLVIDFQLVQSVSFPDLTHARILAELASPFREQVPARYAAYMGRVGTPDLPQQQITQWAKDAVGVLFPAPQGRSAPN